MTEISNKSLSIRLMRLNNKLEFNNPKFNEYRKEVIKRLKENNIEIEEDMPTILLCNILRKL